MGVSDRIVVMNYGRKIAEGPTDEVRNEPEVIAAYLGAKESDSNA
jgi:branched-chain amino acid transport system ATP-binding protein